MSRSPDERVSATSGGWAAPGVASLTRATGCCWRATTRTPCSASPWCSRAARWRSCWCSAAAVPRWRPPRH